MRRAILMLVVLAVAACGELVPGRGNKKVLLIGLDGVRPDVLAAARTPVIDSLIRVGSFSGAAQTRPPTVSGPGWSSMLTGVWPDKHRVTGNDFSGNAYVTYPDFLTRLERIDRDFTTFAVLDWAPLGEHVAGGPLLSDTVDVKLVYDGEMIGYAYADSECVAAAIRYLTNHDPDAAFVYLGNIDVVGHDKGSLSPEYEAAIETADAQVGEIIAALHRRPRYADEDWLVIISTDHGRRDDGGHGGPSPEETRIFYLASGPSVARGEPDPAPEIVDVAVTALTHMGVTIESGWRLDGRAVGLIADR